VCRCDVVAFRLNGPRSFIGGARGKSIRVRATSNAAPQSAKVASAARRRDTGLAIPLSECDAWHPLGIVITSPMA